MQPFSTSWKIAMSIAVVLIMRFAVYPAAKIYVADFGLLGALIACALMYWVASVIQRRRDRREWPRHD
jgi:uncharacterized membrane protein YccC